MLMENWSTARAETLRNILDWKRTARLYGITTTLFSTLTLLLLLKERSMRLVIWKQVSTMSFPFLMELRTLAIWIAALICLTTLIKFILVSTMMKLDKNYNPNLYDVLVRRNVMSSLFQALKMPTSFLWLTLPTLYAVGTIVLSLFLLTT